MYHGLSWQTLASTTDPEKWNVLVSGRVIEKVKKWVREKAAANDIPHILRAQPSAGSTLMGYRPITATLYDGDWPIESSLPLPLKPRPILRFQEA